ncbi:MAG: iron chelate uptake ABC transporter family permease subunit, partial [Opitutales bacterium]|nr:iron chelate uptake ABC transporter family permease subunit [Opitutales bacterium]
MKRIHPISVFIALACTLALCLVVDLTLGSVHIPIRQIPDILFSADADPTLRFILLEVRLPYALTAILVGMGLGMGGMVMQTLLRNPLAEPFILGISSGASLGVVIMSLGLGVQWLSATGFSSPMPTFSMVTGAFLGSSLLMALVIGFSRRMDSVMLLIVGLMAGYFSYGVVSMLVFFRSPEELRTYHLWTLGSFSGVTLS